MKEIVMMWLKLGVYCIPESENQVGFNSFIHADDGFLYINPKTIEYFERVVQLKMEYWCLCSSFPIYIDFANS